MCKISDIQRVKSGKKIKGGSFGDIKKQIKKAIIMTVLTILTKLTSCKSLGSRTEQIIMLFGIAFMVLRGLMITK